MIRVDHETLVIRGSNINNSKFGHLQKYFDLKNAKILKKIFKMNKELWKKISNSEFFKTLTQVQNLKILLFGDPICSVIRGSRNLLDPYN